METYRLMGTELYTVRDDEKVLEMGWARWRTQVVGELRQVDHERWEIKTILANMLKPHHY